jgi:hypothetical protein
MLPIDRPGIDLCFGEDKRALEGLATDQLAANN